MTIFRETPGRMTPDWFEVNRTIPRWFRNDGPSVPKFMVLFRGLVALCAPEFMATWYMVARSHDFGYSYARLPGSGWSHYTKDQWDSMLREGMAEFDYGWWGRTARRGLSTKISMHAWDRNMMSMIDNGYHDYASVVRDREKPPDQMPA